MNSVFISVFAHPRCSTAVVLNKNLVFSEGAYDVQKLLQQKALRKYESHVDADHCAQIVDRIKTLLCTLHVPSKLSLDLNLLWTLGFGWQDLKIQFMIYIRFAPQRRRPPLPQR